jgi:hypothetical protein
MLDDVVFEGIQPETQLEPMNRQKQPQLAQIRLEPSG